MEKPKAGYGARVYGDNTYIKVNVSGACTLVFGLREANDAAGVIKIVDGGDFNVTKTGDDVKTGTNGELVVEYTGTSATTLTITFNQKDNYYSYLKVTPK